MARGKQRASGRGTRDGLTVAFEKVYLSDEIPSLQDFLDLGRELCKSRLEDFIDVVLDSNQSAVSFARSLMYVAARIHQNTSTQDSDAVHLKGTIQQISQGNYWP